jgi:hypothetical protein
MKRTRSVIHGACLLVFTIGSLPGLGGCGSSDATGAMPRPDEVKAKTAEEATAAAFKEFQKTKNAKRH